MSILRCSCGTPLKIKPEMAGKQIRCPNCKQVLPVPADAAEETVGASSDTSLSPGDPPPVNRPRLRSEAMRATTPVTSVQAASVSEGPVIKTVAAVAPKVAAASIPTAAPPQSPPVKKTPPVESPLPPAAPRSPQRKLRVPPPLPPAAAHVADADDLLAPLPPLEAIDPASFGALEPSALVFPELSNPLSRAAVNAASPSPSAAPAPSGSRKWLPWIGGGVGVLALLIVAFQLGRGGRSPPPDVAAQPLVNPASSPTSQPEVATAAPAPPRPADVPEEDAPPKQPKPAAAVEAATAATDDPGEIVKPAPAPAPPPRVAAPPRGPGGLTGVSRQYDDLDCLRIQALHSVRVPAAAAVLEVDGLRLPITNLSVLADAPAPCLYLPRGSHAVKFRRNEQPVEVTIKSDLSQIYHEMRQFFDAGGNVREVELLSRGAKAMDVHSAPFLLNLMGAVHLGKDRPEEAERKFRRALRVNPLFAPAHLNLAALLAKRGATAEARQELELAEATNVGNCFGLSPAITEVRRQLKLPPAQPGTAEVALSGYVTQQSLSEEDRRLTALMQGLSKYAVQEADRAKVLNNLAVHFAESDRAELALDHFRSALGVLKGAGPERYKLAQQVLSHMSQACRNAQYEVEAEEYDRMRSLVTP